MQSGGADREEEKMREKERKKERRTGPLFNQNLRERGPPTFPVGYSSSFFFFYVYTYGRSAAAVK